jgi:hypothetical protein
MAGILDSKTRFIDLIVTQEGKRQIASGKLRAEYASLSDSQVFYDKSEVGEVPNRIYFQVMDSPNNVIVLEKDDSGKLIEFNFSPTGSIVGNDIFDKDATTTNKLRLKAVTGSAFASTSKSIMESFTEHFNAQQVLSTFERSGNEFELSTERINFAISNSVPFKLGPEKETINVNDAEPFFLDSKLTHLGAFDFLPPVNMDGSPYGVFEDIRSLKRETLDQIKDQLGPEGFEDSSPQDGIRRRRSTSGFRTDKVGDFDVINRKSKRPARGTRDIRQFETVYFDKTSDQNNLIMQIFEDGPKSKMLKLDLIDAGSFHDNRSQMYPEKRIFYAGKIYMDDLNVPTFINLFTIVLE